MAAKTVDVRKLDPKEPTQLMCAAARYALRSTPRCPKASTFARLRPIKSCHYALQAIRDLPDCQAGLPLSFPNMVVELQLCIMKYLRIDDQ